MSRKASSQTGGRQNKKLRELDKRLAEIERRLAILEMRHREYIERMPERQPWEKYDPDQFRVNRTDWSPIIRGSRKP